LTLSQWIPPPFTVSTAVFIGMFSFKACGFGTLAGAVVAEASPQT
jgi:hypothetical protein